MINNDCTIDKTAISISDYILALPSKPLFAMANTIVSGITIPQLKKSAIPIAFLIHDYTHPMDWRYLMYSYELSDVIIYPSEFMVKKNHHDYRFNLEKTFVLPQGLYKEEFLNIPRSQESRARIRKELSIPDDAIVLFGNGSVDHRKGVDIFLTLGLNLLSNFSFEKEIHFVWLGGTIGKPYKDEYHKFLSRDLLNSSFENHFHFVKATKNVKPYYDASDIFILTSREDPFPSVVQEAIASGLHIAGFDGTGGAIELIKKAGGLVFPFQNIKLAVEELNVLIRSMKDQNERLTNAKRIIKEEYNFSTYVDNIVGLLIEKMHLQNNETLVNKNNIAK
jgi:glycosyltransferase involved in cell wall biosynthesis